MTERRINHHARGRFEGLRNDLECRLSRVSGHLDPSELLELTARMLRLQIRYDQVTAVPGKSQCSPPVMKGQASRIS